MEKIVLLCEDSIEGMLTAIYDGFVLKNEKFSGKPGALADHYEDNIRIHPRENYEYEMFTSIIQVETDDKKVTEALKKLKKSDPGVDSKLRDYMCENYYDIRTFGAVMTTFVKASLNCGQVRGPVQLGFARSIDPVISQEVTITRVAITTEKDAENKSTEMGRKSIVPYALYRAEGFISANLARKTTGFTEEDLELLWDAIINMFENDHSAARGKMSVRELIVFKHSKELGDCPAYKLFDAVEVTRKENVEYPRRYQDYTVEIHNDKIPESVEVKRMI